MSVARSVADVLRDHVVLELEAIDRMYLNVYVPHLQTVRAVVGYLRVHRGQRFASTTAVVPMSEAFVRNIEQFADDEAIDLVSFQKRERKDDVTQRYLRSFRKREGVLYVGKAQEKVQVAEESAELYRRSQKATELRLKVGDIAAADAARLRVEVARAENDARAAQSDLAAARVALAYFIGQENAARNLAAADPWPELGSVPAPVAEGGLDARPDVQAALARVIL